MGVLAIVALTRTSTTSADPAIDSTESQFLTLVNQYRQQNGLSTLVLNVDLNEAADWYVTDMTAKNYFGDSTYCAQFHMTSHCDSYGGGPAQRVSAFGYGPATMGENAAAGFSSAEAVFTAWKGSPGHNTNMLRSYWKAIGIAVSCRQGTRYGCYWVTDFGSVDSPPKANKPYPDVLFTRTPTAAATQAPTPSPTPKPPTPTPAPRGLKWQDLTCDGVVLANDAVTVLLKDAGLPNIAPAGAQNCPDLGESVYIKGTYRLWGDVDCSGAINSVDSVKLLLWLIGTPIASSNSTCAEPGTPF